MTREELIAKLEAATEGSRELDYMIRDYLWPGIPGDAVLPRDFGFVRGVRDEGYAEEYTTSLDAALTLVPEGEGFILEMIPPNKPSVEILSVAKGYHHAHYLSHGATPALCLCIAALKARTP